MYYVTYTYLTRVRVCGWIYTYKVYERTVFPFGVNNVRVKDTPRRRLFFGSPFSFTFFTFSNIEYHSETKKRHRDVAYKPYRTMYIIWRDRTDRGYKMICTFYIHVRPPMTSRRHKMCSNIYAQGSEWRGRTRAASCSYTVTVKYARWFIRDLTYEEIEFRAIICLPSRRRCLLTISNSRRYGSSRRIPGRHQYFESRDFFFLQERLSYSLLFSVIF